MVAAVGMFVVKLPPWPYTLVAVPQPAGVFGAVHPVFAG